MTTNNIPLKFIVDVNVLPDFFDYSNLILTVITVVLSLFAIYRTLKESRTSFEIGIINMVQEAKINMDNNVAQLLNNQNQDSSAIETSIENYLNALNAACAMYFSKDVKRKRFEVLFLEDIKNLYNSVFFHSMIYKKIKTYPHLKKFIIKKKITNIKK